MALLAILAIGSCEALKVKWGGGTGPVEVEMARQSIQRGPAAASRFAELSHAAHENASAPAADCFEEKCVFIEENSCIGKTQQQRLKKKAKKLQKQGQRAKKIYLENHSQEEYEVLKNQALVDALEEANTPSGA